MADKPNQPTPISIELPEDIADGQYSNMAVITHNQTEFVLDFIMMAPNAKAKVKSRIILTPQHAKRLLAAMAENIKRYEAQFGSIYDSDGGPFPNMNFNTPTAQA